MSNSISKSIDIDALIGKTPRQVCCLIKSNRLNVNACNSRGENLLLQAINRPTVLPKSIVAELLRLGANPNMPDMDGCTALKKMNQICCEQLNVYYETTYPTAIDKEVLTILHRMQKASGKMPCVWIQKMLKMGIAINNEKLRAEEKKEVMPILEQYKDAPTAIQEMVEKGQPLTRADRRTISILYIIAAQQKISQQLRDIPSLLSRAKRPFIKPDIRAWDMA